ncbi:MAG: tetratricopeptide repeat domain protein [Parcubacteria group bacterium Licking1014_17]|nr:MAG: tetratricopeptide repeat domain protein [Parcubacteria group bacterium Licking1014_17]
MNKIDLVLLKILRYALLFSLFFPLIIFRNSFSPFNFGKLIVFRTYIEILLPVFLYLIIKYPQLRPWKWSSSVWGFFKNNLILCTLGLFLVSYIISTFAGVNWRLSFWGSWERMGGLFSLLHYFIFFLMVVSVIRTKDDWVGFFWILVSAAFISSAYGFLQKFTSGVIVGATGRFRIVGTSGNAAAFAGYLVLSFFVALYLYTQTRSKIKKGILAAVCCIFSAAVVMTLTRGTILALILGAAFIIGWFIARYLFNGIAGLRKRIIIAVAPLILVVVAALSIFFYTPISQNNIIRRLTFTTFRNTVSFRLIVWNMALSGIKDKPILGWGPENFESVFSMNYNPKIFGGIGDVFYDRAHNFVLDIASTQGIPGIILWMAFIISLLIFLIRERNPVLIGLLIAYCVHNFFFFDLFSTYMIIFVIAAYVQGDFARSVAAAGAEEPGEPDKIYRYQKIYIPGLIALLILMVFLAVFTNIKPAMANYYSTRSVVLFSQNMGSEALSFFDKAYADAYWSKWEVRRKLAESYISYIFNDGAFVKKDYNRKYLSEIISGFEEEIKNNPDAYPNYIYLSKAYRADSILLKNNSDGGVNWENLLLNAQKKFPNLLLVYNDLFDFYMEKGKLAEARTIITDASVLRNKNSSNISPAIEARLGAVSVFEGLSLKNEGEIKNGLEIIYNTIDYLHSLREVDFIDDHTVIFLRVGDKLKSSRRYKNMAELYRKMSEINQKYFILVSYSYLLMGDRQNALLYADKSLELKFNLVGKNGFKFLSDIYKALGDNKKRSEALLKDK